MDAYLEALRRMPADTKDRILPLLYYYLAKCYDAQEMYKEAIDYNRKAYLAFLHRGDTADVFHPLRGIGHNYLMQNEIDSSLFYYRRALSLAETNVNPLLEAYLFDDLSKVYFYKKKDSEKAYAYIAKSIAIDSLASFLCTQGEILMKMGELDSARVCFLRTLKTEKDVVLKARCYLQLREIEKRQKNFEQAYSYADSSDVYVDSIYGTNKRKQPDSISSTSWK